MSPIVEFRMRSPEFALAPTLSAVPDARLEVLREAATDPERPQVLFWADFDDRVTFESALADDPTVAKFECFTGSTDHALYRVAVSDAAGVVTYPTGVELGLTPLKTVWTDGWWHLEVQFPRRDHVGAAEAWCEENGVEFEVERLYTHDGGPADSGLTDEQREVLHTAYDLGYFEIPREASMADVADALGLSSQAVSERLRRGYRHLVAEDVPE